jgi:hypothetical protein
MRKQHTMLVCYKKLTKKIPCAPSKHPLSRTYARKSNTYAKSPNLHPLVALNNFSDVTLRSHGEAVVGDDNAHNLQHHEESLPPSL